jgi:hypothetical protein
MVCEAWIHAWDITIANARIKYQTRREEQQGTSRIPTIPGGGMKTQQRKDGSHDTGQSGEDAG